MRALKISMVVMGVLIVLGVGVVIMTITQRLSTPKVTPATALLDEPAGTRIAQISAAGDRMGVLLQGGGKPDRVVVLDLVRGQVMPGAALAR